MKEKLKTSLVFTKNWFTTGTIAESSRETTVEICKFVPKEKHKVIVEFGMGHGNITREILNVIDPTSKVYSFEINKSFCEHVGNNINDDRLIIINDCAENINAHISEEVHAVVGSIPYSFFSKEKQLKIIQETYERLANNSYYSQLSYFKFNFKKFRLIFNCCFVKTTRNIPKAYIYHCKKELN